MAEIAKVFGLITENMTRDAMNVRDVAIPDGAVAVTVSVPRSGLPTSMVDVIRLSVSFDGVRSGGITCDGGQAFEEDVRDGTLTTIEAATISQEIPMGAKSMRVQLWALKDCRIDLDVDFMGRG